MATRVKLPFTNITKHIGQFFDDLTRTQAFDNEAEKVLPAGEAEGPQPASIGPLGQTAKTAAEAAKKQGRGFWQADVEE